MDLLPNDAAKPPGQARESSEPQTPMAAGDFGAWLVQMLATLRGEASAEVPCGDCVGCCTSSYFVLVRPEDKAARARIPVRLLVPAPGLPDGNRLLAISSDGSCPMLAKKKCSIYEQRPRTCRDYDCRVFAAAGIEAGAHDKSAINLRVRAWRFTYSSKDAEDAHRATRAAAAFIKTHAGHFPGERVPTNASDIAVLAMKVHGVFLGLDEGASNPAAIAHMIIEASRAFDAGF